MLGLITLATALAPAFAAWQTIHNSNFTLAYVRSVNGTLFKLPISDQNVTAEDVENHLTRIASAPTNSSLVLDNDDHLFAVWGSEGCGGSPIEISQYDSKNDQWKSVGQSDIKNQKWYQDSQIVWLDRSTDQIYIYGGTCNGRTQSGFYRYNLSTNAFEQIEAQGKVMPRQMSAAQAVPLNDYQTLILGGRSDKAWMSMQQIALWGHGSWTFTAVSNSSGIDSRENPLLLPIWKYGQNGSTGIVEEILVIGGTVAGRAAKPEIATLKHSDEDGWYWTVLEQEKDLDVAFGASTLYATLANINGPDDNDGTSTTSSSGFSNKVALFDQGNQNNWTPVKTVSITRPSNTQTPSATHTGEESHSTSTATIAVVSTLLPIIVLSLLGIVGWWWWHKRRQNRLFLLPNRRSMLRRQPSTNSSVATNNRWSMPSAQNTLSTTSIPPIPQPDYDNGSIMMVESEEGGRRLFMSKQRRNLRVVNPDAGDTIASEGSYNDEPNRRTTSSAHGSRDSSWSSSSNINPFGDHNTAERRSEFDFGL